MNILPKHAYIHFTLALDAADGPALTSITTDPDLLLRNIYIIENGENTRKNKKYLSPLKIYQYAYVFCQ